MNTIGSLLHYSHLNVPMERKLWGNWIILWRLACRLVRACRCVRQVRNKSWSYLEPPPWKVRLSLMDQVLGQSVTCRFLVWEFYSCCIFCQLYGHIKYMRQCLVFAIITLNRRRLSLKNNRVRVRKLIWLSHICGRRYFLFDGLRYTNRTAFC